MPPAGMAPGPGGRLPRRARARCARAARRSAGASSRGAPRCWRSRGTPTRSKRRCCSRRASARRRSSPERAWACGMAEGELEPLAPDGARMQLAWGEALLPAASLARVARAGEVLVDGDVRALRAGQLSLIGARAATDAGQRVRGWKLDLAHPWKRPRSPRRRRDGPRTRRSRRRDVTGPLESTTTLEMPALQFTGDELSTDEVLEIVEATAARPSAAAARVAPGRAASSPIASAGSRGGRAERGRDGGARAMLRRARAEAEVGLRARRAARRPSPSRWRSPSPAAPRRRCSRRSTRWPAPARRMTPGPWAPAWRCSPSCTPARGGPARRQRSARRRGAG